MKFRGMCNRANVTSSNSVDFIKKITYLIAMSYLNNKMSFNYFCDYPRIFPGFDSGSNSSKSRPFATKLPGMSRALTRRLVFIESAQIDAEL